MLPYDIKLQGRIRGLGPDEILSLNKSARSSFSCDSTASEVLNACPLREDSYPTWLDDANLFISCSKKMQNLFGMAFRQGKDRPFLQHLLRVRSIERGHCLLPFSLGAYS